jgi:hypothetical protein
MGQPPSPAATIVTILPHHLEEVRAARFLQVRSAILKTSQPRAAQRMPTSDQLTGLLSVVCGSDMLMPASFDQFIMRAYVAILSCLA